VRLETGWVGFRRNSVLSFRFHFVDFRDSSGKRRGRVDISAIHKQMLPRDVAGLLRIRKTTMAAISSGVVAR